MMNKRENKKYKEKMPVGIISKMTNNFANFESLNSHSSFFDKFDSFVLGNTGSEFWGATTLERGGSKLLV